MKYAVYLVLIFASVQLFAQEWKEKYTTAKGDTVKVGTKIKLVDVKHYNYVYPSPYFYSSASSSINKEKISEARYGKYRDYLNNYLKEETVEITRLTRQHGGKDNLYKSIAVFTAYDKHVSHFEAEYYIDIEQALKYNEIEIIK